MRSKRGYLLFGCAVMFLGIFAVLQTQRACAQTRVNDKDVEALMRNVRDDAKSFRPTFDAAIRKSTIRKTSHAKDAKELAAHFEKQTDAMLDHFKQHHKGSGDLQTVLDTASQIDKFVGGPAQDPQTTAKWEKIHAELRQLCSAYGIPD